MSKSGPAELAQNYKVEKTLGLLDAIDSSESHTQRSLADKLGVALGLANSLLKRAARKGLIKIHDIPARRYAYYLTPRGFQEKNRLVGEYLKTSLNFFRAARDQYESALDRCLQRGWKRVVLVGTGELAELASLASHASGLPLVGIIDERLNDSQFCGLRVFNSFDEAGQIDAVIITDSENPQQTFDRLVNIFSEEKILTPSILHVSRNMNKNWGDGK